MAEMPKGETNRTIAYSISRDRWVELYWGPDRPGVRLLAAQLGVNPATVRYWLRHHGIRLRTRSEQKIIDVAAGRCPNGSAFWTPEIRSQNGKRNWRKCQETPWSRTSKSYREAMSRAKSQKAVISCAWCGNCKSVKPSELSPGRSNFCNRAHAARYGAHLRSSGVHAARPLILQRLRDLFRERFPYGTPLTLDRLEKVGGEIGAADPEYDEVMLNGL